MGHGRSGHSIVGALLDAHPDIILSDELDALRYLQIGFSRGQLFSLSAKVSADQARSQRRKAGRAGRSYSYFVGGQSQGVSRHPLVIGVSRAGGSIKRLAHDPRLLDKLRARMRPIQLRFVLVVRNPFDNIATMMIRRGRSFASAFEEYFGNWEGLLALQQRISAEELLLVRHETLLANPREELIRLCSFLGVDTEEAYLAACADILYTSPSRSRDSIAWSDEQRAMMELRMAGISDLHGYTFDG